MTSGLGKAVRRQFDETMRARLPQFAPYRPPAPEPHTHLYRWRSSDDLTFFVLVFFGSKPTEAFTIELAWSRQADWKPHTAALDPYGTPSDGFVSFRLCELFDKRPQFDPWWEFAPPGPDPSSLDWASPLVLDALYSVRDPAQLSYQMPRSVIYANAGQKDAFVESARPLVPLAVDQAIDKIEQYALPYFERIASQHARKDG